MVTLPAEAASDSAFVRELVKHGMDLARINCALDVLDNVVTRMQSLQRKKTAQFGPHYW